MPRKKKTINSNAKSYSGLLFQQSPSPPSYSYELEEESIVLGLYSEFMLADHHVV